MATIMRVGGGAGGGGAKTKTIASLKEGDLIAVRENGVLVPFFLAKKDYEPDLNGNGRYLLVRKTLLRKGAWNSTAINTYENSKMDTLLNTEIKAMYSGDVLDAMGTTTFPYTIGNKVNTLTTLTRSIFLLSLTELGFTEATANVEGSALTIASQIRIAQLNGVASMWSTRTPSKNDSTYGFIITETGSYTVGNASYEYGIRPCFTLPSSMAIADEPNADGSYSLLCDAVLDKVGQLPTGDTMLITENGIPTEYYIAKHGYEPELNTNRTLLTRKDLHSDRQWNATNSSAYATSDIDEWLNGEFYNSLSAGVRELIGATTFPYTIGAGDYTVSTLTRAVFLLSATELGLSSGGYSRVEGTKLPIADALKIAYYNGTAQNHWLRSPYCEGGVAVFFVDTSGALKTYNTSYTRYARPSFTIPSNAKVIGPDNYGRYTLEVDHVPDVYGIARDITASSPEWVRTDGAMTFSATASIGTVAGASDFDNVYPWSEMQRVTLETGDVMVRIPKFYYGRYRNGNIERIQISGRADVGLSLHPAFNHAGVEQDCIYVGAYKAGIDQTVSSNWKATSLSGVAPMTGGTRQQFRMWAQAKGSGWSLIDISTLSAIQMLYLVEFANNNSQAMVGRGYCDGNSAALNTGSADTVPNLTGRVAGTDGKTDIVYRGIEGLWGNVCEWVDGINWMAGGEYWICNNPNDYADNVSTNYSKLNYIGATSWSGSYISTIGLDATNPHIMLPSAAGSGSESTYICDAAWSGSGNKVYANGGYWADGSKCGLFTALISSANNYSDSAIGSRLIYIPQ